MNIYYYWNRIVIRFIDIMQGEIEVEASRARTIQSVATHLGE